MSNIEIKVRKIKYEDIERVIEINTSCWEKSYKDILDDEILIERRNRSIERVEKWQRTFLELNALVAEYNNEVIGYCIFSDKTDSIGCDSEIKAIYIDVNSQKLGVGRKLVDSVKEIFRAQNKKKMIIWCLKDNMEARKFYEKIGGIPSEEIKYFEYNNKKFEEIGYIYEI